MIDIHCHILPGLDDGPTNLESSIKMAHLAEADGIKTIIATPHFNDEFYSGNTKERIMSEVKNLQKEYSNEGIDIELIPGCEVGMSVELPELLRRDVVMTLNSGSYMLIELPAYKIPIYCEQILFELQVLGIKPIIAHPERNIEIQNDIEIVKRLFRRGILFQTDAHSLLGLWGRKVKRLAWNMLNENLLSFVASDAHSVRSRQPVLRKAYETVANEIGFVKARKLFQGNADMVIANMDLLGGCY